MDRFRKYITLAACVVFVLAGLWVVRGLLPTTPPQTPVAAPPLAVAPTTCGRGGEPDCVCQGDDRPTRIMKKDESVIIHAERQIGFDPAPSPSTIKLCTTDGRTCVSDNETNLKVGGAVMAVNLSGGEYRMYCRYHD